MYKVEFGMGSVVLKSDIIRTEWLQFIYKKKSLNFLSVTSWSGLFVGVIKYNGPLTCLI